MDPAAAREPPLSGARRDSRPRGPRRAHGPRSGSRDRRRGSRPVRHGGRRPGHGPRRPRRRHHAGDLAGTTRPTPPRTCPPRLPAAIRATTRPTTPAAPLPPRPPRPASVEPTLALRDLALQRSSLPAEPARRGRPRCWPGPPTAPPTSTATATPSPRRRRSAPTWCACTTSPPARRASATTARHWPTPTATTSPTSWRSPCPRSPTCTRPTSAPATARRCPTAPAEATTGSTSTSRTSAPVVSTATAPPTRILSGHARPPGPTACSTTTTRPTSSRPHTPIAEPPGHRRPRVLPRRAVRLRHRRGRLVHGGHRHLGRGRGLRRCQRQRQYLDSSPLTEPRRSMDQFSRRLPLRHLELLPLPDREIPPRRTAACRPSSAACGAGPTTPRAGPDNYSLEAVRKTLQQRGTSLTKAFARFAQANRMPGRSYDEGKHYPKAPLAKTYRLTSGQRQAPRYSTRLDHLASTTVRYVPSKGLGGRDLAPAAPGPPEPALPRDGGRGHRRTRSTTKPTVRLIKLDADGNGRINAKFTQGKTPGSRSPW